MNRQPIGIFDSGIGGLTVARAIIKLLPQESFLYYGDTARNPYGTKSPAAVRQFSKDISQFLAQSGCKAIVLACNTATAHALNYLRESWPAVPFVGMEPAVKPGARATKTGIVGVMATAGTFSSQRYAKLMQRYASHITVIEDPCLGLVEQIESGALQSAATESLLRSILEPMLAKGADTIVLGCTHYPFVIPLIQQIAGPEVSLINPAPAVARQLKRVLKENGIVADAAAVPDYQFRISGPAAQFPALAKQMLDMPIALETEVLV